MCARSKDEVPLEVDHLTPVVDGGSDELENLATLCRDCNGGKSAYRFSDYRRVAVVPPGIEGHLKYFHDSRTGRFDRYHLYLDFKNIVHHGPSDDPFHHTWIISDSDFAVSSDKAALEQRRRTEEQAKFLVEIKRRLIADGKRLVENEEGICKVHG